MVDASRNDAPAGRNHTTTPSPLRARARRISVACCVLRSVETWPPLSKTALVLDRAHQNSHKSAKERLSTRGITPRFDTRLQMRTRPRASPL